MIHALKTKPEYFNASAEGVKRFEVRMDDRPVTGGEMLVYNR